MDEPQQSAEASVKKPKLKWLKIEKLRNVEPCELRFGDGFNVLLGLNATGKTTLLELIAAAVSFDFKKFENDEYVVRYCLEFSGGSIEARAFREVVPKASIPIVFRSRSGRTLHTGEAEVGQYNTAIEFSIELLTGEKWKAVVDAFALQVEGKEARLRTVEGMPGVLLRAMQLIGGKLWDFEAELRPLSRGAVRFDEALKRFQEITDGSTWIQAWPAEPTGTSNEPMGFRRGGSVPLELLNSIEALGPEVVSKSHDLTIGAERLPFLRAALDAFELASARVELRLVLAEQEPPRFKFGQIRFMFDNGRQFGHEELSYGQTRLLAFYYHLACFPFIVVADEIVDGLHYKWIRSALDAIGDRQAFLASQNPLLLDHLEFASPEEVKGTFITCVATGAGKARRMAWANLSAEHAERFFRAYDVGMQHVSEILRSKGLW